MKIQLMTIAAAGALAVAGCASTSADMDSSMDSSAAASDTMAAADSKGVMIGGAAMLPTNTIVENAMLSNNHKTLVSAVKAAGLVETLSGPGPFTVFAPTDAAFARIPAATLTSLMQPEMKAQLSGILTYHVVSGNVSAAQLIEMINSGGGSATLTTVNGGTLTATLEGEAVKLTDARGGAAYVTVADAVASNGVVHEVNGVLLPAPPA